MLRLARRKMTKKTYQKLVKEFWTQIEGTREEGQKEYARDDGNIFANFERVSTSLNINREKALMTYLLKHIDGIISYIDGHQSQREEVDGRIKDAIVYLLLLWAMVSEKNFKNEKITAENEYWTTTTTTI